MEQILIRRLFSSLLAPIMLGTLWACAEPAKTTDKRTPKGEINTGLASSDPAPAAPTLVVGTLVLSTPEGAKPPAAEARVFLEGYPELPVTTTAAGTFTVTVPDEAFGDGASLAANAVGWYALHEQDGASYGVEQPNVVIGKGEINDLGTVPLVLTGGLSGHVEGDGTSLAGARVVLPGTIFETRTDGDGNFEIPGVPAANWSVTISLPGYRDAVIEAVEVASGGTARIPDVSLEAE